MPWNRGARRPRTVAREWNLRARQCGWRDLHQHPQRHSRHPDARFRSATTEQTWQLISYFRSLAPTGPAAAVAGERVAGDAAAGKVVFNGKGACATCHQVNGVGGAVGPDLSAAGKTAAAQLVAKIENPNQAAAGGRGGRGGGRGGRGGGAPATVVATTKDGKVYRGARKSSDSLDRADGRYGRQVPLVR